MSLSRIAPLAAGLAAAAAVAGCVGPFESADPETPPHLVSIDDQLYSCGDSVSFDDVCDEYEIAEGTLGLDAEVFVTSEEDGTVVIQGLTYECDDFELEPEPESEPEPEERGCEEYELEA